MPLNEIYLRNEYMFLLHSVTFTKGFIISKFTHLLTIGHFLQVDITSPANSVVTATPDSVNVPIPKYADLATDTGT